MAYTANKIGDGLDIYKLGDTIELMLELDSVDAIVEGPTITVDIKDYWDNTITQVIANKIGNGLYVAEYTIPLNFADYYNVLNADESSLDPSYFYMKDVWVFSDASFMSFSFMATRISESPIVNNVEFEVAISDISNTGNTKKLTSKIISFTTKLDPFYASVDEVISIYRSELKNVSVFDIATGIVYASKIVDLHMKPDTIYDVASYNNAVSGWVSNKTAYDKVYALIASIKSERKVLDAMEIEKTYRDNIHGFLTESMDKYALIILAGGLDTPFKNKIFIKGIYDPNRPSVGSARMDESVSAPWLNATSPAVIVTRADGSVVEYRGSRTLKVLR